MVVVVDDDLDFLRRQTIESEVRRLLSSQKGVPCERRSAADSESLSNKARVKAQSELESFGQDSVGLIMVYFMGNARGKGIIFTCVNRAAQGRDCESGLAGWWLDEGTGAADRALVGLLVRLWRCGFFGS